MEYGLIPKLDQFVDNKSLELQQIQASQKITKTDEETQLNEVQKEEFLGVNESAGVQKTASEINNIQHEVVLTNMNFGYNDSSKDFYIRTTRGNIENQYPTEDMMKLKSYLMAQAEAI